MIFKIEIDPEGEEDLSRAYCWYQSKGEALADRFMDEAIGAIESLSNFPYRHPVKFDNLRALPVKGFPYLVYFRIVVNTVEVVGIRHTSMDRPGNR